MVCVDSSTRERRCNVSGVGGILNDVTTENATQVELSTSCEAFYDQHNDWATRFAWLMVREPNLAEDIAHDAFANVYKRLESLTNPSGYLRSTLTNTVFERSRQSGREKRRIRLITATEPTHVEQPSGGLSTRHQTNQIGTFDRSMVGVDPIDNHRPERSGRCHVSGEVWEVRLSVR